MKTKSKPKQSRTEDIAPRFTTRQVERALVANLSPALADRGGTVLTFSELSMTGHGLVLRLSGGQEFWCTLAEAAY
ncbi:MAG: hypothetical protein U0790_27255 [Isosphaeraceae bacterium]